MNFDAVYSFSSRGAVTRASFSSQWVGTWCSVMPTTLLVRCSSRLERGVSRYLYAVDVLINNVWKKKKEEKDHISFVVSFNLVKL